ncbi:uncharacterized protein LOC129766292 [Toxorhynchites rutilus septentrionalis]|uniref:uncharacterized protein LOC129766292 n=1 Tax=Toxorhynchites rutilus septentrionalis TaxID=329112 RepID=UPI002478F9F8|nr:uncharacterized protein LOC129766292 [Toxorhynchites rutilus septentrionalis]
MEKLQIADVENEYTKFPELKREDVQKIREWMEKQPHLPKISDLEIVLFLHSNYSRIEPTKQTIDANYTCRTHVPEFFAKWDYLSSEFKTIMDLVTIVPLAIPTEDSCKVVYGRLINTDVTEFTFEYTLKFLLSSADLIQREHGAVYGYRFIIDMEGVTMGHVTKLTISIVKKFLHYLQEAMPVRLKGIHLINVVPFIDKIMMLVKPFMKKELVDILHLHSAINSIYPFVQKQCLTGELGGNAGSLFDIRDEINQHLLDNRDFFLEEEKKRVVEERRPGKPKDSGSIFGMEGNFKKLDIDYLELILFLVSNYFKMEAAKQTIDCYYTCRTHVPMYFANRDMLSPGTKKAMDTIYGLALQKQTHEGYVVFYGALKDFNPSNFDLAELLKLMIYIFDLHFMEHGSAKGYRIVIDMDGVLFGHVARLGVLPIKHFLYYLQEAMPIRLKGLHFTNIVTFMDTILALLKPFMKKELLDVLFLHTSNEQMYPYVDKECLPKDRGGYCESREVQTKKCYERLLEVKDYFLEEEKTRRVDEGKRPGKPKTAGELFGVEGNFRKLDID